jgi:hypothetical protein
MPKKHFLPGLTKLSERDLSGLEYIDPTAFWQISRYSHGLCQRLQPRLRELIIGLFTITSMIAKLFGLLELQLKLKIDF